MIPLSKRSALVQGRRRVLSFALPACAAFAFAVGALHASPIPGNLGNGLDRLIRDQLAVQDAVAANKKIATHVASDGREFSTLESAGLADLAIKDDTGRYMVRIYGDGSMPIQQIRKNIRAVLVSFDATAVDRLYKGMGVMNAWVALEEVPALSAIPGVRTVVLELKPRHNGHFDLAKAQAQAQAPNATTGEVITQLGTYTDQGVLQHKVDQINKFYNPSATSDFEGAGLAIACISNSFNANAAHPASIDVTNNDLPGNSGNPLGNTTPVFVIADDLSTATSDDEGRGMCQIVYKMAPKAKVGFGTADSGEVGFANTIRGLAGLNTSTFPNASTQGFAADVICDDVGYFDEPFYQDGIIGAGIEDVAAAGVSYFSSAANDIGVNGYESVIRVVSNDPTGSGALTYAAGNQALVNTNINLANVPPGLYAGGFHNFNPSGDPTKQDVAQLVNVAANNTVPTVLQWNDPYDQNTATTGGTTLFTTTGTYTATDLTYTVTTPVTQGTLYQVVEAATAGSTFDGIVTVYKSDGVTVIVGPQDTGTDETVRFAAPANDTGFVIKIGHFSTTTGSFTLTVSSFTGFNTPLIGSDWNLLAFNTNTGAYVPASSLTTNNLTTNQPIEIGFVNRTSLASPNIQYVLARSNIPTGRAADHIRYLLPGNGRAGYGPAEYFTYNTVTTSGHATSPSCNGMAAYPAFRPNVPEYFSSPGPATIYFDNSDNLLATPDVRLQPKLAAMDAGNISANEGLAGLGSDSTSDYDAAANFSGTSAASPHGAACALLTLEAHGGRRSLTPAQITSILQATTFPHDLDPNFSSGSVKLGASKVALTFSSDNESNAGTGLNDANSLAVAYTGPSYIASLVFNPAGAAATGGNTTAGNNGLDLTNTYFSNVFPGLVFPATTGGSFAVGNGSVGLTSADVTATTSNLAPAPSTTQNWTLTLNFPNNNFTGGKLLHFTISRSVQHSSVVPSGTTAAQYSADLFGGSVLIPDGTGTGTGMTFTATLGNGQTLTGTLNNRIGSGYSKLDGFGFINVQAAASATP